MHYDHISDNKGLDLATLQVLAPKEFASVKSYNHLVESLKKAYVVLGTLWGAGHGLAIETKRFHDQAVRMQSTMLNNYSSPRREEQLMVPNKVLFVLNRRLQNFMDEQRRTDTPLVVPNFSEAVWTKIQNAEPWEPQLPRIMIADTPLDIRVGSEGSIGGLTAETDASTRTPDASTVSGLSGAGTGATPSTSNAVTNDNFNALKFSALKDKRIRTPALKQRLQAAVPPIALPKYTGGRDRGKTMCLSFHIKAFCNKSCGSAHSHRQHTPAEDDILAEWCTLHYSME
jgi:hypothetical protein